MSDSAYPELTLKEVSDRLAHAESVLIFIHRSPDGDCVGSASGLCRMLADRGKRAAIACADAVPHHLAFLLPPWTDGVYRDGMETEFDLLMSVDTASPTQLGTLTDMAEKIALSVDHHGVNTPYCANHTEPDASATAEILFDLYAAWKQAGVISTDPEAARALYAGILTDTGCMKFANTTVRTFRIAAELAAAGADTYHIIQTFFETKTKTFAALERLALDGMRLYFHDRCALMCITQEMYRESGSDESETDRLTNLPRQIEGVRGGVTLRDGEFKASVRTHGEINAAAICKRLGGGGHTGAAGCTLHGTKQQAINALLREVQAELDTDTID